MAVVTVPALDVLRECLMHTIPWDATGSDTRVHAPDCPGCRGDARLADLDALVQAAQKIGAGRLDEKGWTVAAWQEFAAALARVLGEQP